MQTWSSCHFKNLKKENDVENYGSDGNACGTFHIYPDLLFCHELLRSTVLLRTSNKILCTYDTVISYSERYESRLWIYHCPDHDRYQYCDHADQPEGDR